MKTKFTLTTIVMTFTLFSGNALAQGEEAFWKWFAANEKRLFAFEANQEAIFDELGAKMNQVNGDLTFEFGPVQNGKREFVISAGGIQSAFPAVETLYNKAPKLKRWVWVKFRPRRLPISDLEYGGKRIRAGDVRYVMAKDGDKVGIVLFFDGYTEEEKDIFGQIGYLFLDESLGEYAVETQVGFIEFQSQESKYFSRSSPLEDLPKQFDEYFRQRAN